MPLPALNLPTPAGIERYELRGEPVAVTQRAAPTTRRVFAAAHVVVNAQADIDPSDQLAIDWEKTLAFRAHLLGLGLGVAEAMDTAQRGMGLDWPNALELVRRTCSEFGPHPPAPIFAGCGTDQLAPGSARNLEEVTDAYLAQIEALQKVGARLILMASNELARVAQGPECYAQVYGKALAACDEPVILHWLGDMFAPALAGYWGAADLSAATDSCLAIIAAHSAKIDGIKLSLLDQQREIDMRRRLPAGVRMYTGDDFNYPELIAGDESGHSDALLGIFDPIAPLAAAALADLDAGDTTAFRQKLEPSVALARLMFSAPTYHYKVGVVFLAWLNGQQDHFCLLGGIQGMRSIQHLAALMRHADACGLLAQPDLAVTRMTQLLAVHGINQPA